MTNHLQATIVTWNDFSESYVCPVALPGEPVPSYLTSRSSHAGYLELSRYYIEWYKTGRQPALKDALFWFYRVHPKNAVAAKDRPVTAFHGEVQDVLYVTTMSTAPAELHVTSGGTENVRLLGAGIQHLRIPFSCGPAAFRHIPWREERPLRGRRADRGPDQVLRLLSGKRLRLAPQ